MAYKNVLKTSTIDIHAWFMNIWDIFLLVISCTLNIISPYFLYW